MTETNAHGGKIALQKFPQNFVNLDHTGNMTEITTRCVSIMMRVRIIKYYNTHACTAISVIIHGSTLRNFPVVFTATLSPCTLYVVSTT